MTAEIHAFTGITCLDTTTDRILDKARDAGLTEVVIIGFKPDGNQFFESSVANGGDILWHLQRAIHKLMSLPEKMSADQN